jgi:hypothetical protein
MENEDGFRPLLNREIAIDLGTCGYVVQSNLNIDLWLATHADIETYDRGAEQTTLRPARPAGNPAMSGLSW